MAFVAVEAARGGLTPMAALGIHGGDDPVLGDPAGDGEHPIWVLVQVLSDDGCQQCTSLGQCPLELLAVEHGEHRLGVFRQVID